MKQFKSMARAERRGHVLREETKTETVFFRRLRNNKWSDKKGVCPHLHINFGTTLRPIYKRFTPFKTFKK